MIDVSRYIMKLEALKRWIDGQIDLSLEVHNVISVYERTGMLVDKSRFVKDIPFDEYFLYFEYTHKLTTN